MKIAAPSDLKNSHSHDPICGVVATAVVTGLPIEKVWRDYAVKHRSNWRGRLEVREILDGIKAYGVKLKYAEDYKKFFYDRISLKSFVQRTMIKEPETVFLVFTTAHVQVVQGRNVVDQGGLKDFMDYRWNRKKLDYFIYRVNSNGSIKEVNKQEIEQVTTNKETKFMRATKIVNELLAEGVKRKDILAKLSADLPTTWGSASTFYHRIVRETKQKEVA